jgi:hypothetical protein
MRKRERKGKAERGSKKKEARSKIKTVTKILSRRFFGLPIGDPTERGAV